MTPTTNKEGMNLRSGKLTQPRVNPPAIPLKTGSSAKHATRPTTAQGAGNSTTVVARDGTKQDSNEPMNPETEMDQASYEEIIRKPTPARELEPYPNHSDDPDTIDDKACKKDKVTHQNDLREYSHSMLSSYGRTKIRGELMWSEFITAFRPHTIRSWTRQMIVEWSDLLNKRGIYVENDRVKDPSEATIDLLFRNHNIGTSKPAPSHEAVNETTDTEAVPQDS